MALAFSLELMPKVVMERLSMEPLLRKKMFTFAVSCRWIEFDEQYDQSDRGNREGRYDLDRLGGVLGFALNGVALALDVSENGRH